MVPDLEIILYLVSMPEFGIDVYAVAQLRLLNLGGEGGQGYASWGQVYFKLRHNEN